MSSSLKTNQSKSLSERKGAKEIAWEGPCLQSLQRTASHFLTDSPNQGWASLSTKDAWLTPHHSGGSLSNLSLLNLRWKFHCLLQAISKCFTLLPPSLK